MDWVELILHLLNPLLSFYYNELVDISGALSALLEVRLLVVIKIRVDCVVLLLEFVELGVEFTPELAEILVSVLALLNNVFLGQSDVPKKSDVARDV